MGQKTIEQKISCGVFKDARRRKNFSLFSYSGGFFFVTFFCAADKRK